MYNYQIFSKGVHSSLQVRWKLKCETPLVIRNGLSISYEDSGTVKSRGLDLKFKWKESAVSDHQIAALHYGYEIVDSRVIAYHFVPPSSVRGALRSWTARHLVSSDVMKVITPLPKEEKVKLQEYLTDLHKALENHRNGYELIASLFGLAFEIQDEPKNSGNAGRLQIETEKFSQGKAHLISANGIVTQGEAGPSNARRQMTVRNPLDRITHASKDGGLHHFLEFCQGEVFTVNMSILNPRGWDIGLLSLWVREMGDGLLRLGALANIGRGRVSFAEQSYTLWKRRGAASLDGFEHFEAMDEDHLADDALVGLWQSYHLPVEKLREFEAYLEVCV